jgi:DNA-binding transcriptional LysR family regulator
MELDQVHAFLAIVRRGGFTRASASLHLSQPAISRRIHLLERELGAPLFDRVGARAVLSEAGRAFLPHAEALVACARDGVAAVAALRDEAIGPVTLALVGTLASSHLTASLREFRERHPGVELRLETALSAQVSELVRRGEAALGLRYGGDAHPELVSRLLYAEPLLPVCAADHPLACARRVPPTAVAGERWLRFPRPRERAAEPYAAVLEDVLASAGLHDAEILAIDSLTAQKRMVEAGFGLALLPASSVDEEFRAGTLCQVHIAELRATLPVVLIHRRNAFLSRAVQSLAQMLAAAPPAQNASGSARSRRRRAG